MDHGIKMLNNTDVNYITGIHTLGDGDVYLFRSTVNSGFEAVIQN